MESPSLPAPRLAHPWAAPKGPQQHSQGVAGAEPSPRCPPFEGTAVTSSSSPGAGRKPASWNNKQEAGDSSEVNQPSQQRWQLPARAKQSDYNKVTTGTGKPSEGGSLSIPAPCPAPA